MSLNERLTPGFAPDEARLPEPPATDVVRDVVHLRVPELRVAQARHGVVFVQAARGLGGGLVVPAQQRAAQ